MKKLLLILIAILFVSCCKEEEEDFDCSEQVKEINIIFDNQVLWVIENTDPDDQSQIDLLNEERDLRILKACAQ